MNKVIFPGRARDSALLGGKPPEYYLSRPNLLNNWYFADVVNQRGYEEYLSSESYTIDRWYKGYESCKLSIKNGFIRYEKVSELYNPSLQQKKENLDGCIITLSSIYRLSSSVNKSVQISINYGEGTLSSSWLSDTAGAWRLVTISALIPSGAGILYIRPVQIFANASVGTYIDIKAVKLELDACQSLAYQNIDGDWVLFDKYDKVKDLLECQRYYQVHSRGDIPPQELSPPMRINPRVSQRPDGLWAYDAEI